MTAFRCQPEFYTNRKDTWDVLASMALLAAEQFAAIYNNEMAEWPPESEVRVISPNGAEAVYVVQCVSRPEYTAKRKLS